METGSYRRLLQMLWDSPPANNTEIDLPIHCLGLSYLPQTFDNDDSSNSSHLFEGSVNTDSRSTIIPGSTSALGRDSSRSIVEHTQGLRNADSASPAVSAAALNPHGGWPLAFINDFASRIWMTYRSDFPPIPKSTDPKALSALSLVIRIKSQLIDHGGFTSDSGWGCMIRSGQSLLANAMIIQQLGRAWRRGASPLEERKLLSLFADDPRAPYSIHSFVSHGAKACGKFPGEWFGPSATASCIQALTSADNASSLKVYATSDSPDVDEERFMAIAQPGTDTFHPTLILIGTRLGTDKITTLYWKGLFGVLQMPQSVGIAGGRPSSSHYFVASQGEHLFYLDPHHTRRAFPFRDDPATYSDAEVDSCHTTRLRQLHIKDMDPSMLIGFLIRDKDDWNDWKCRIEKFEGMAPVTVSRQPRDISTLDERASAIDEVESLSESDNDGDGFAMTAH